MVTSPQKTTAKLSIEFINELSEFLLKQKDLDKIPNI